MKLKQLTCMAFLIIMALSGLALAEAPAILVARFRIGPYHFCNASKGFEPSAGDEILLFDYVGPEDRTGTFYAPRFEQLVFQKPGGNLLLSPKTRVRARRET